MTRAIDWSAPLRFKTAKHVATPQSYITTDSGNVVIRYTLARDGGATVREFFCLVDRFGNDKEAGGFDIENYTPEPEVPKSPENCLLPIRCDDCFDESCRHELAPRKAPRRVRPVAVLRR